MYQACYYKRNTGTIHIWDDNQGHLTVPFNPYAYVKDPDGEHLSIYGDKLSKIYKPSDYDSRDLFESDVNPVTRFLVDTYSDSDIPSEGHRIVYFDIEVSMEGQLPDINKGNNEITSIALYDQAGDEYYVFILDKENKLIQRSDPYQNSQVTIIPFITEEELLMTFLDKWSQILPTIITGWNTDYFDVPYLCNRISRVLGEVYTRQLSPINEVFWSPYKKKYTIAGVSSLDYYQMYRTFNYTDESSYTLDYISKKELNRGKVEYKGTLDKLFKEDIKKFIEYNLSDVELVVALDDKLQFIDLARGICHSGHVTYEDFIYSSRWIEGAILTLLKKYQLVSNNKPLRSNLLTSGKNEVGSTKLRIGRLIPGNIPRSGFISVRKSSSITIELEYVNIQKNSFILKEALTEKLQPELSVFLFFIGAYVKEPIPGKYDWIYDLDLTSLYPSIIMSLNISPETKVGKIHGWDLHNKRDSYDITYMGNKHRISIEQINQLKQKQISISSNGILYTTDKGGIIPEIIETWFNKRKEYQTEMRKWEGVDEVKRKFYDKRQHVQKIFLNSVYGVLGLPISRFYDVDNAEAVTTVGQEVIKATATLANDYYNKQIGTDSDHIIYIDTDSIFLSALPLIKHLYPDIDMTDDPKLIELIKDIINKTQSYINRGYNSMAKVLFNLSSHRFEIKQEVISKSGLWIAKKRYAQWQVYNYKEGMIDEMEVKGLDVVRSSFPPAFKGFMKKEILEAILKNGIKDDIDQKIIEFRQNLINVDPNDLAKISAVHSLVKYNHAHDNNVISQFEKSTPAHIKGAISYNKFLSTVLKKEVHEPIRIGEKIKWVYLKDNEYTLKSMAFKGWDDPPEVTAFISKYIDRYTMFDKELKKKIVDIYNAMGWTFPAYTNKQVLNKFFG